MTPEEVEAQIRADHPEFRISEGKEVTVISPESDPDAYESMIQERVAWRVAHQEQESIQQGERDEFSQARAIYTKLKTGSATANETQRFLALIGRHVYRMSGESAEEAN